MSNLITPKIYTPHGFVKENIFPGKKVLDVGCGQRKLPGSVGIDIVEDSAADVIHDISQIPWPFEDNTFDVILIQHTLEHADDVLETLGEMHRIAKPGAHIIIQVPYFRSVDAFVDPTHAHFFTSHSLDYFFTDTKLSEYRYISFRFKKLGFWYGWPHHSKNPARELVKVLASKYPNFYDQYLSLLFPVKCLTWEIEVVK